jgi:hypothetical protein
MSKDVAQRIQDWLDQDDTKWEASTDVVDWAGAYGADIERAWAECPRADFLMAIAGACGIEPWLVLRASSVAAREAVTLLPAKVTLPRKAVHLAESYRVGREIAGASSLIARTMSLVETLDAENERRQKALIAAGPAANEVLMKAAMSLVVEGGKRNDGDASGAAIAEGKVPEDLLAFTTAILERTVNDKAVEKLRERTMAARLLFVEGHAVRAAASSLIVAESTQLERKCAALVGSMVNNGRATEDTLTGLDEAASIARRSRARVYSEAALVFDHAARAIGGFAATERKVWSSAIVRLVTALIHAVAEEPGPEQRGIHYKALDAYAEQATAAKLAEYASQVRAAIPLSALHRPGDEPSSGAAEPDPRDALLASLTSLAPLARFLDNPAAAEAMETATAILRGTGPLDRRVLAQALRTVHERMDAAFRERSRETTDAAREEAEGGAMRAARAMREMDEVLAELGSEKPS